MVSGNTPVVRGKTSVVSGKTSVVSAKTFVVCGKTCVVCGKTSVDQVYQSHGIPLYIDMMSFQYLEGTEIDYVEGLYGAGFKFINPQATATCGCGSSFAA